MTKHREPPDGFVLCSGSNAPEEALDAYLDAAIAETIDRLLLEDRDSFRSILAEMRAEVLRRTPDETPQVVRLLVAV